MTRFNAPLGIALCRGGAALLVCADQPFCMHCYCAIWLSLYVGIPRINENGVMKNDSTALA